MNNVFVKNSSQYVFVKNSNQNVFVKSSNQYAASRQKEITGLLEKGVFEVVNQQNILSNIRIFNFDFVDEVKHSGTNIQDAKLYFRDITQAYVQFSSKLNEFDFYIRPSKEPIKMIDVDHNFILKQHTREERSSKSNELSKLNHFYIRPSEELIKMLDVDHNFILKNLCDITQSYVQFSSKLKDFYIHSSEELIKVLDVDHNFILKHHTKEERSSNIRLSEELIKMFDVDHNFFLKNSEYNRKHSSYDRRMSQYLMHCEGEDSKDDSAQFFEKLTLDVSDNIIDEEHTSSTLIALI